MSWVEIIEEQLNVPYKPNLANRISYYEAVPLKQVHMDTAFFTLPLVKNLTIPVLVIVDVATKYVRYYKQNAKNDNVSNNLKKFMDEVKKVFKDVGVSKETVLITDGALELVVKDIPGVTHKFSVSKNKAAIAESAIMRARREFRKKENKANILNIRDGKELHYPTRANFQKFLDEISTKLNETAGVKKEPLWRGRKDKFYGIGTPVLAVNMEKFYPWQLKAGLKKKGYMQNWTYEPYWISNYKKVQNVYKYTLTAFQDNQEAIYYYYSDQIQPINPKIANIYISKFLQYKGIK